MNTSDGVRIRLERYECILAAEVGMRRHLAALWDQRADRHGFTGDGWGIHIEGAAGEMAFAKSSDMYWSGSVNTFNGGGDVGHNIQVRTRSSHDFDLIIRSGDSDDSVFVLVTGAIPDFWVRGWLWGREGKIDRYLQNHGGRPPAWFVPSRNLRPLGMFEAVS